MRFIDLVPPVIVNLYKAFFVKSVKDDMWVHGLNRHRKKLFINEDVFQTNCGFEHEDILIDYLLGFKKKGFYIDIGANDPEFTGNTKRFYDKGWHGINVEPQEHLFEKLKIHRKGDVNLCLAVGNKNGEETFYELPDRNDGSSLNIHMAKLNSIWHKAKIVEKKVKVVTLKNIFEKYLKNKKVDFMSIDIEGFEYEALKGNDWNKYRPKIVIVEIAHFNNFKIVKYLKNKGYILVYNNLINGIFAEKEL